MILHSVNIPEAAPSLVPLGDVHVGPVNCDEELLERTIAQIKEKAWWWIGMGDYVDAIKLGDKRFDPALLHPRFLPRLDDLVYAQCERFLEIVAPIKDRCIGLLCGNHEEMIRMRYGENVMRILCQDLKAPNLEYNCFIRLSTISGHYLIFAEHGRGGGAQPGTKLSSLMNRARDFHADLFLRGHVHERMVRDQPVLTWGGEKRLKVRHRLFALTGTYLQTYAVGATSSYGEKQAYMPIPLGAVAIHLNGERIWGELLDVER